MTPLLARAMLSRLNRPMSRARLRLPLIRTFAYPKEGVFQRDSPPREIPGFGPAPPMGQYQSKIPQPRNSSSTIEPGQASRENSWTRTYLMFFGSLLAVSITFFAGKEFVAIATANLDDPLEPGSEEDKEMLDDLFEELEDFDAIKQLRQSRSATGQPFKEYTAYSGFNDEHKAHRLTTGPLAGSAGVAAQKVFITEDGTACFVFINFGSPVCGWPGMIHGGMIMTIFDETLGRVAIRNTETHTGFTASLGVSFRQAVKPGRWYVLRATMNHTKQSTDRKKYVLGAMQEFKANTQLDSLDQTKDCAVGEALFVVPRDAPLRAIPDEF